MGLFVNTHSGRLMMFIRREYPLIKWLDLWLSTPPACPPLDYFVRRVSGREIVGFDGSGKNREGKLSTEETVLTLELLELWHFYDNMSFGKQN